MIITRPATPPITQRFISMSRLTAAISGRLLPGGTSTVVNTGLHQNPVHLSHSAQDNFFGNFAGYFSEFTTLISVDKNGRLTATPEVSAS